MRRLDDPSDLTPDERLFHVASILAAGVLRLRGRAAIKGGDAAPERLPDSGPACLEMSEETVLSVHTG